MAAARISRDAAVERLSDRILDGARPAHAPRHPRRRHQGLLRRAAPRRAARACASSRASRATSRASSWSPRAPARRSPSSRPRWPSRANASRSSRRVSRRAAPSAAWSPRASPVRRAAAAGPLRDYVLGVDPAERSRRAPDLRRPGDEERRGLRCFAADRGLVGSARRDVRSLAEGAGRRGRQRDAVASTGTSGARSRELARWNALPLPLSASAWHDGCAARATCRAPRRRCAAPAANSAARSSIAGIAAALVGRACATTIIRSFGRTRRELAGGECLWRISVPPATPGCSSRPASSGGAERSAGGARARRRTGSARSRRRAQGHATLVRAADKSAGAFAPLGESLMRIHRALKSAFDPDRVFNPGRLYADL